MNRANGLAQQESLPSLLERQTDLWIDLNPVGDPDFFYLPRSW